MNRRDWIAAILGPQLCLASLSAAKRKEPQPTALLFGTVFRDSYLALPGARVVAYDEANPRRKYRAVTNYRGEYRIRVPAGDARFVVTATAPKFAEGRRTVQVYGIEKSTANLVLEPRSRRRGSSAGPDSP